MMKPHICWLHYLFAAILMFGFTLGVFFFKILLRGAEIGSQGLLLGAILGLVLSGFVIRLKKPFFLMVSSVALGVIWFVLPWNSSIAPVTLGCGFLCGMCSIPYVALLLSSTHREKSK